MPTRKRGYIKTDMKNERYIKARQIALDEDTGGAITEADGGDGLRIFATEGDVTLGNPRHGGSL